MNYVMIFFKNTMWMDIGVNGTFLIMISPSAILIGFCL